MSTPKVPVDADDVLPDPEADVQLGAQVRARIPGIAGAVIAVRVPRDLLTQIADHATVRRLSVSEVVLAGVERLVAGTEKDVDE